MTTDSVVDRGRVGNQKMTDFGRTLYALMLSRGIDYKQDLAKLLTSGGYKTNQSKLSMYLNGKRTPPTLFVECVAALLRLTDEERLELADAYAYRSRSSYTDDERETIETMKGVL